MHRGLVSSGGVASSPRLQQGGAKRHVRSAALPTDLLALYATFMVLSPSEAMAMRATPPAPSPNVAVVQQQRQQEQADGAFEDQQVRKGGAVASPFTCARPFTHSLQTKWELDYILTQQDIVKKAELAAKRQSLRAQEVTIETALQQKITEERAAAMGAKLKGREDEFRALQERADELEEKQDRFRALAGKQNAKLDRVEMLERARTVMAKKAIERALAGE